MGWVGPLNGDYGDAYTDPPGHPLKAFVPQWPVPNSPRVDGTLRWLSEPEHRPYCTRWQGWLEYSISNPHIGGEPWDFTEFFYIDLVKVSQFVYQGTTGVSPYGSSLTLVMQYMNELPGFAVPGIRFDATMSPAGEPTVFRTFNHPELEWDNSIETDAPLWTVPPLLSPWAGATFPWCNIRLFPMAWCYPLSAAIPPDPEPDNMNEPFLGAMATADGTGQNMATTPRLIMQAPEYSFGGTWWDAGAPDELIIPANVKWADFRGNVSLSGSNSRATMQILKNGVNYPGQPLVEVMSNLNFRRMNSVSPIISVAAGDVIQLNVNTSVGTIVNADQSYLGVVVYPTPTELLSFAAEEPAVPLAAGPYVPSNGLMMIPPAFDEMVLAGVTVSCGDARSTAGDITIQFNKLAASSRASSALLSTVATIEQDDWTSLDAATQPVIDAGTSEVASGDVIECEILGSGTGAQGLLVTLKFQSPN